MYKNVSSCRTANLIRYGIKWFIKRFLRTVKNTFNYSRRLHYYTKVFNVYLLMGLHFHRQLLYLHAYHRIAVRIWCMMHFDVKKEILAIQVWVPTTPQCPQDEFCSEWGICNGRCKQLQDFKDQKCIKCQRQTTSVYKLQYNKYNRTRTATTNMGFNAITSLLLQ